MKIEKAKYQDVDYHIIRWVGTRHYGSSIVPYWLDKKVLIDIDNWIYNNKVECFVNKTHIDAEGFIWAVEYRFRDKEQLLLFVLKWENTINNDFP